MKKMNTEHKNLEELFEEEYNEQKFRIWTIAGSSTWIYLPIQDVTTEHLIAISDRYYSKTKPMDDFSKIMYKMISLELKKRGLC